MIQSRTAFRMGDVVLVRFVISDGTGARRRPAVILSSDEYNQGRQEAIVAAITGNMQRLLVGDHVIGGWREAGLLYPSVATGIVRTIKRSMIERTLGRMGESDLRTIRNQMRRFLGL